MILAFDIEGRGPSPSQNGIVSIGICVGSSTENLVGLKWRINIKPYPDQVVDEKYKIPGHYEELTSNAISPSEAMKMFRNVILDTHDYACLLTRARGYDDIFINYYLDRERLPRIELDENGAERLVHQVVVVSRYEAGRLIPVNERLPILKV